MTQKQTTVTITVKPLQIVPKISIIAGAGGGNLLQVRDQRITFLMMV